MFKVGIRGVPDSLGGWGDSQSFSHSPIKSTNLSMGSDYSDCPWVAPEGDPCRVTQRTETNRASVLGILGLLLSVLQVGYWF